MALWKARKLSWSRLSGFLLVFALLTLRIVDPIFVERLRLQAFDQFQRLNPREIAPFPVAILDIDDRSLSEVGQWPWPRTTIAELTDRVFQEGAAAMAYDIVFSEPDRLSPNAIAADNPGISSEIRSQLMQLPSNDTVLAQSFSRNRVVLGETSVRSGLQASGVEREIQKVPHAIIGPDPRPYMLKFPELVQNLPILNEAAPGRGVFTVLPDADGIYRRVPIVMMVEGALRLSLSLELLRIATGGDAFAVRTNDAGIDGVVVAGQVIKTQGDGTVWTRFSASSSNRFVSAADLLQGKVPQNRLAGHLVLVGTSAIGLEDFRATPLGVPMAGVEIHAQLLENVLAGTLLKRENIADGKELLTAAAMTILVIALAPMLHAGVLIISTLVLVSAYGIYSYLMFLWQSQLVDPTFPIVATMLTVMLMSSTNYLREERRRNRIRNAFGQYVTPALVAQLADSMDALKLGGERRDLSVLFSDVRGFTTISEEFRDDPQGLTKLMNEMLTVMSEPILKSGGTIDKFMGDAVMAFWNAPLETKDHPRASCRAALEMVRAVEEFNRNRMANQVGKEPVHPIHMGVAVNSGPCFVGNMGSNSRFDYTALGDTVNVASRLEGQTKHYGMSIIIGERTAQIVDGEFALLELDLIRVKGKHEPERIFGLMGGERLAGSDEFKTLSATSAEMLTAYRTGQWQKALELIAAMERQAARLDLDLHDYCALFSGRIARQSELPEDPDWDGIFDASEK
ncbi:adenylate/guanylate cyclase domain-containing protein [Ruegeria sp. WL0004]|uniref:Adenylate/guanylate cyclase domain-containing protein n=1 Tax=Ruegeria marisflavi TaxID=2984152 RepID=A0ABT2WT92_9RHOB|nr:adenylate/guanylate cyclase domain-containing protein [Ruegeria sp. WL0004]MCU9839115.1 adenylate/guanylate cyclase domain-containing protein [Ruegeria sp. WL0004]